MEGEMSPNGAGGDMIIEKARSTGFINQENVDVCPREDSGIKNIGREH
jgi:hypothetical protein